MYTIKACKYQKYKKKKISICLLKKLKKKKKNVNNLRADGGYRHEEAGVSDCPNG